jgi:hypothetical protein
MLLVNILPRRHSSFLKVTDVQERLQTLVSYHRSTGFTHSPLHAAQSGHTSENLASGGSALLSVRLQLYLEHDSKMKRSLDFPNSPTDFKDHRDSVERIFKTFIILFF